MISVQETLRHYPSTPHLESLSLEHSSGNNLENPSSSNSMKSFMPTTSSFTTFSHHHRSGGELKNSCKFRDDPNPYKVSTIEQFSIRVHDPYRTKSTLGLNRTNSTLLNLHERIEDERVSSTDSNSLANSGGYEVPDPDYGGSSGGSSEDLPLPTSSNASVDYSHSLNSTSTPSPLLPNHPTISERKKIELSLSGHKTDIFVSDSLANLYYMRKKSSGELDWVFKYCGVPVLLLDTGETKSRDKRRIQLVLSEPASGLALWKDIVDNLSSYSVVDTAFHTMHLSSDHTQVVGLSFDSESSAQAFWNKVEKLTSDFANISLSGSKTGKKKVKKKLSRWMKPNKSEISQPCMFQHVSSLSPKDKSLPSLQHFVVNKNRSEEEGGSLEIPPPS